MDGLFVLHFISIFFVVAGITSAILLAIEVKRRPQPMMIMNSVWVLTGLWGNIFALWAYFSFGRDRRRAEMKMTSGQVPQERQQVEAETKPGWKSVALSTLHCGAGCTLADILGEWFFYFVPFTLFGSLLAGNWILDYGLALLFGMFFQYAAIRSMERISPERALGKALKADFLSLTAWQVGMYCWMLLAMFVLFEGLSFRKTTWEFWFMMQVSMGVGFLFSYPVNVWLIKRGIKRAM